MAVRGGLLGRGSAVGTVPPTGPGTPGDPTGRPGTDSDSAFDRCVTSTVDAGQVELARRSGPSPVEIGALAGLFKLLGDPTRTRILYALLATGGLCVCDIAAAVDSPETSVSQALRLLRTAGVVVGRRSGRRVFYSLADDHVRQLLEMSRIHAGHGR